MPSFETRPEIEKSPEILSAVPGVIAVTGASRGTGAEVTQMLLEEGFAVVAGYADPRKEKRALEVIEGHEGRAVVCQIDVTDPKTIINFFASAAALARRVETNIVGLAQVGAGGIGKDYEVAQAINADGPLMLARHFWNSGYSHGIIDTNVVTAFATSAQGHTSGYPDQTKRVGYPEVYRPIAETKYLGELNLRRFSQEFNESHEGIRHSTAVVVADVLPDSSPIKLMARMVDRANPGDSDLFLGREKVLENAGSRAISTEEYARAIFKALVSPLFELEHYTVLAQPIVSADGEIVWLEGNPLDWEKAKRS